MSKTKVKMTKDMGRGVFATQNINKKIVVESSPCLTWSDRCHALLQDTILRFYVFEGKTRNHSVLALGVASLFNHSSKPNLKYKYDAKRNVMTFTSTRKIYKGEQLFVDYGYDPVEQLKRWELQKVMDPRIDRYNEAIEEAKQTGEPYVLDPIGENTVRVLSVQDALEVLDKRKSLIQSIKDFFKGLFK